MGVKRIKICHKRNDCIGCGSCALLAPKSWKMNSDDGKSDLADAKWKGDDFMVALIDPSEYEANKKAAQACPVNIIRID